MRTAVASEPAATSQPTLSDSQIRSIEAALAGLSTTQLKWVSAYVVGLAANGTATAVTAESLAPAESLTILYGSQTGNGQAIAERLYEQAQQAGMNATILNLAEYRNASLKREHNLSVIISTHGEGDPPDDAELFREYLLSRKAPELIQLKYSVLALGDSSYVNFCQTGREIDDRLAELGATRIGERVECDLDYETDAAAWAENLLVRVGTSIERPSAVGVPHLRAVEPVSGYDKQNPYAAEMLTNQKITGSGSSKDVRHIELSLGESGLSYEPGDSLAIEAINPPGLIEQLLEQLQASATDTVEVHGKSLTLLDALRSELEITTLSAGFIRTYAEQSGAAELSGLLEPDQRPALAAYLEGHQVIDVLRQYPAHIGPQAFVEGLRRMTPRSYSIASSPLLNPDEVHLTVAAVRYTAYDQPHWGAASTYLADRRKEGDELSVFVERNSRFRLPADTDTPIIMIGPGTGVAPFRAFVEQRAETGAAGANWLFFGERNFRSDFLYQLEWQRFLKRGVLQRMDVAFSRDQQEKIYVQQRIKEQGADVYDWLEQGASVYVCGDAKHMAADVQEALVSVVGQHGGRDEETAREYLQAMRRSGRYLRDVY